MVGRDSSGQGMWVEDLHLARIGAAHSGLDRNRVILQVERGRGGQRGNDVGLGEA